jgi:hypothetical protein
MKKNIKELISECEKLYSLDGETRFIFDKATTNDINKKMASNKEDYRDISIDSIIDDEEYYISDFTEFEQMPSRFSLYDTQTKLTCHWTKHKLVKDFLFELGFNDGLSNLGPEFEQSFVLNIKDENMYYKCIIRIKPNLIFNIQSEKHITSMDSSVSTLNGFFNKSEILSFLKQTAGDSYLKIIREVKLNTILD